LTDSTLEYPWRRSRRSISQAAASNAAAPMRTANQNHTRADCGTGGERLVSVDNAVRDLLEVTILVAVAGMLWSAVRRVRRGEVRVVRCVDCGRPTSRAYPRCKHCGALQPDR
jgi:hypothetical protein